MKNPHHLTVSIPNSTKTLGGDRVFVIAEIGKNFIQSKEDKSVEEYLKNAKALVDAAVSAGVDAVKFQTHEVEDEVLEIDFTSPHFNSSDRYSWVTRNMNATPLDDFWRPIKKYCDEKNVMFFSTPMSRLAAKKLEKVGDINLWKVGSGDVQDYVLLDHIIDSKKPVIISTGMVSLDELDEIVTYIDGRIPLIILYCISQYPCPPEMFNLSTIEYLREKYPDLIIGFSDHSVDGFEVDLAAIKMGARVVEKHFSFDRNLWGSDHKASILPLEMKEMVEAIRNEDFKKVDVSPYYGRKEKEFEGVKNIHRPYFNKALMAGCDIDKGTVVTEDMVYAMRPVVLAGGLPANCLKNIVGKKTLVCLKKYDPFTEKVAS
ncbi:MAG: N-acetylneuraminate synthase family protein [Candidatus Pacebacteria bacterium]|jgi:sialic acid synthase SpsE|nr:hypothetical protein [bacterium]MDP6527890.1 N-acetylneuraminate synthase family protein [Candidatus Paceibacterota bacterium]MDP6659700.1 N-acetylneuraminate synthase family protein [Candidatus Paceibacterota bacterium]|tara:strand:- start:27500 stop:28621 length:1122 start_codon:yes stop_codon:yes gene_type:complete